MHSNLRDIAGNTVLYWAGLQLNSISVVLAEKKTRQSLESLDDHLDRIIKMKLFNPIVQSRTETADRDGANFSPITPKIRPRVVRGIPIALSDYLGDKPFFLATDRRYLTVGYYICGHLSQFLYGSRLISHKTSI